MVHDRVWAEVGSPTGWLCPPCLAERLGRPITLDDFEILPSDVDMRVIGKFRLP
jgi:hypothetical protein